MPSSSIRNAYKSVLNARRRQWFVIVVPGPRESLDDAEGPSVTHPPSVDPPIEEPLLNRPV